MPVHLLIDGYNLIRKSASLRAHDELALELGREALLERLRQYKQIRAHHITVVFDASTKPLLAENQTKEKGIRVIYPSRGQIADAVIKRICRKDGSNLVVVTSDRELASYAEACGSVTMDSQDFEDKMELALHLGSAGVKAEVEVGRWTPSQGTRKKGPAKRLSKKERRQQQMRRKL